jgi:microcystin-dependent protein
MLDSLSAYIVTIGSIPVPGVIPFHIDNPNSNVITLRFACLTKEVTLVIAAGLLIGDLDIEVSLYFSGMHRVKTNMMTITATQLQSVLSKTIVDGGGTNSTYIHRDQATSFVAKYVTNVKKFIYIEDSNANTSVITDGLQEQLGALFQAGIDKAERIYIRADAFGQVWQSADLNPDRITSEMSNMFTFNATETARHNNGQNYYSINQRKDCYLPVHTQLDIRIRTLFITCNTNKNDNQAYETTSHNAVSESDIKKAASQASIEGIWTGHKFIPKSFQVHKLVDVVDRLQVAVIAKQLLAEKANGAVIRRVGASTSLSNALSLFASLDNETLFASLENISLLSSLNITNLFSPSDGENLIASTNNRNILTGEIKLYAGSSPPLSPWLLCDGSIISRSEYPRLFSVIGTKYGNGNNSETFRLPDLRGRVPIGVDAEQLRINTATDVGIEGGKASHTISVEQLPSHVHDSGTFQNSYNGEHTHSIHDPGHNHGGFTSTYAVPSLSSNNYGEYNYQASGYRQWQAYTIPTSFTQISLYSNGNHTHQLTGDTGATGQNESFSILPPFQTFYYVIYAD